MDNMKLIGLVTTILLLSTIAVAFPILPSQYYGEILIDGEFAPIGTSVVIIDSHAVECGSLILKEPGRFEISCKGDDPDTYKDEGSSDNELVFFSINGEFVERGIVWKEGAFRRVDFNLEREGQDKMTVEFPSNENSKIDGLFLMFFFVGVILFISYKYIKEEKW
jgi:hypothetical protein